MQWGEEKSEMWLTAMLLGLLESVFLLQPIKVVVVALLLALIFKEKIFEHKFALAMDDERKSTAGQLYIHQRGQLRDDT